MLTKEEILNAISEWCLCTCAEVKGEIVRYCYELYVLLPEFEKKVERKFVEQLRWLMLNGTNLLAASDVVAHSSYYLNLLSIA